LGRSGRFSAAPLIFKNKNNDVPVLSWASDPDHFDTGLASPRRGGGRLKLKWP
jgi:hypothetical protein